MLRDGERLRVIFSIIFLWCEEARTFFICKMSRADPLILFSNSGMIISTSTAVKISNKAATENPPE
jgi:hypothetical protein